MPQRERKSKYLKEHLKATPLYNLYLKLQFVNGQNYLLKVKGVCKTNKKSNKGYFPFSIMYSMLASHFFTLDIQVLSVLGDCTVTGELE